MWLPILLLVFALSTSAAGQEPTEGELAKQSQNPAGFHHNKMIYVLNVQPVIPQSPGVDL